MKMKILFGILAISACIMSCSTKSSAVSDLRSLSEDIKTKGSTYTVEEWKEVKDRYEKINSKIDKYEYTAEEYEEIGRLKGECAANFATSVVANVKDKVVNVASQVKGLIEGVTNGVKSAIEEGKNK